MPSCGLLGVLDIADIHGEKMRTQNKYMKCDICLNMYFMPRVNLSLHLKWPSWSSQISWLFQFSPFANWQLYTTFVYSTHTKSRNITTKLSVQCIRPKHISYKVSINIYRAFWLSPHSRAKCMKWIGLWYQPTVIYCISFGNIRSLEVSQIASMETLLKLDNLSKVHNSKSNCPNVIGELQTEIKITTWYLQYLKLGRGMGSVGLSVNVGRGTHNIRWILRSIDRIGRTSYRMTLHCWCCVQQITDPGPLLSTQVIWWQSMDM